MSDLLNIRNSLQSYLNITYSLFSAMSLDESLQDEVQDKINRLLEIVKFKTENVKIPDVVTEVDVARKERKKKEKEEVL